MIGVGAGFASSQLNWGLVYRIAYWVTVVGVATTAIGVFLSMGRIDEDQ